LLLIVSGTAEVTIDEIGEINDHIQSEARTNVDIIMGVGEDESLGEAISVTVIATGFNADQQKEISNTDSKRIVHTLVEDRDDKKIAKPAVSVSETTQKVSEPVLVDKKAEPASRPEETLLNDFKVTFEEIKRELPFELEDKMEVEFKLEEDFIIHDTTGTYSDKIESQESENQFTFTFDFPVENKPVPTEKKLSVNDIEIVDLEYVIPEIKVPQDTIRHTLELEEEFAPEIEALKEVKNKVREDEDLEFEVKVKKEVISNPVRIIVENLEDEVSPLNLTIAELRERADSRRDKMKMFNYKFSNSINKNIDELETQPAYKRMGVDIKNTTPSEEGNNKSRFTLGVDDNSEIQLRSNNSFLHDNVD
jgi:cell division protein FtsZ